MHTIRKLTAEEGLDLLPQLVALLQDSVCHGASVGFTLPLTNEVAERFWHDIFREVGNGNRALLAVSQNDAVVGSVQLALCTRPNGLHRAEVQKLFVHTSCRRQGIATALMNAIEREARYARRTLLYLDTEPAKPAAKMYEQMGWNLVGEIPDYASTPDGDLHGTAIFYRKLQR